MNKRLCIIVQLHKIIVQPVARRSKKIENSSSWKETKKLAEVETIVQKRKSID